MACGNQRTVGSPASLAGTSLHTGQPVTLTLKPAPADFGIKFRRVDIPDQPFISADVEKVQTVERATSLAEGSVKVLGDAVFRSHAGDGNAELLGGENGQDGTALGFNGDGLAHFQIAARHIQFHDAGALDQFYVGG